jgi:hypothetical protein
MAGVRDERHTATLLLSGKVLVVGGSDTENDPVVAEIYDPVTGRWSLAGAMARPRFHHTATLLPSGKVLVVGGYLGFNWMHLYDPATGTWSSREIDFHFIYHTATLLPSGQVLMVGGMYASGAQPLAFLYTP